MNMFRDVINQYKTINTIMPNLEGYALRRLRKKIEILYLDTIKKVYAKTCNCVTIAIMAKQLAVSAF